jgi:hypothetical protein
MWDKFTLYCAYNVINPVAHHINENVFFEMQLFSFRCNARAYNNQPGGSLCQWERILWDAGFFLPLQRTGIFPIQAKKLFLILLYMLIHLVCTAIGPKFKESLRSLLKENRMQFRYGAVLMTWCGIPLKVIVFWNIYRSFYRAAERKIIIGSKYNLQPSECATPLK